MREYRQQVGYGGLNGKGASASRIKGLADLQLNFVAANLKRHLSPSVLRLGREATLGKGTW